MIIFVNRVDRAKKLTELLRQKLFNPICIHSQLKQEERIKNYDLFKANGSRLLVATDLFGRGIDIERVNLVINYGKCQFIQISQPKETPTCTEWAEQAVLEPKVWQSIWSGPMRKRTRREEPTRQCLWTFKMDLRWRFWSFRKSLTHRSTCDLCRYNHLETSIYSDFDSTYLLYS